MKKMISVIASVAAVAGVSLSGANAANELSGWGTVTQVIVTTDEVRVYIDLSSIPNPASCTSDDSISIITPASPSDDNFEPMLASALSALAGDLEARFNIIDAACSATNRPRVNQIRLRKPV